MQKEQESLFEVDEVQMKEQLDKAKEQLSKYEALKAQGPRLDPEQAVGKFNENFKCGVCLYVIEDVVTCKMCGTGYCKNCITIVKGINVLHGPAQRVMNCPSCRSENAFNFNANANRVLKSVYEEQRYFCRCGLDVAQKDYKEHFESCIKNEMVTCISVYCKKYYDQIEPFEIHLRQKCKSTEMTCRICDLKCRPYSQFNDHSWMKCYQKKIQEKDKTVNQRDIKITEMSIEVTDLQIQNHELKQQIATLQPKLMKKHRKGETDIKKPVKKQVQKKVVSNIIEATDSDIQAQLEEEQEFHILQDEQNFSQLKNEREWRSDLISKENRLLVQPQVVDEELDIYDFVADDYSSEVEIDYGDEEYEQDKDESQVSSL